MKNCKMLDCTLKYMFFYLEDSIKIRTFAESK